MTQKQACKYKILPVLFFLLLPACASLPQLGTPMGSDFKPLSSDVAALAAPQAPGGAQTLYCMAGKGAVHLARGWVDFATTRFILPPGGRAQIPLEAGKGVFTLQGYFDAEGQKIIFCPVVDAPPEARISCSSIYALDDDLQMGIKRTFDVPDAVRGGSITCAYAKEKLQKL